MFIWGDCTAPLAFLSLCYCWILLSVFPLITLFCHWSPKQSISTYLWCHHYPTSYCLNDISLCQWDLIDGNSWRQERSQHIFVHTRVIVDEVCDCVSSPYKSRRLWKKVIAPLLIYYYYYLFGYYKAPNTIMIYVYTLIPIKIHTNKILSNGNTKLTKCINYSGKTRILGGNMTKWSKP